MMRLRPVIVTLLFVVSLSNKVPAGAQFPPLAVAPFDGPAAELHQQTWAKHLKVDVEINNSLGMKLRLIPAGEFQMGSSESEEERISDEQQHTVRITKAFYLGKYEVTQGEWKAVMGSEPWKGQQFGKEGAEFPATSVSWEAAADFCQKLSKKEGKEYRLPTEAEWEYACRGGKATRFHFGDDETVFGGYAWYDKNALDINEQYAHPVGQKKKNPFGLYDMHGNVWEWSSDWYAEKYYASSPTNDPQGSETKVQKAILSRTYIFGARECKCIVASHTLDFERSGGASLSGQLTHCDENVVVIVGLPRWARLGCPQSNFQLSRKHI